MPIICIGCRKPMKLEVVGAAALYNVDTTVDIQEVDTHACDSYVCVDCGAAVLTNFADERYKSKVCLSALPKGTVVVTTVGDVALLL